MCHRFFARFLLKLLFGYLLYIQYSICQINVKIKHDVIRELYPNASYGELFLIENGKYTGVKSLWKITTNNTVWLNLTLYGHSPNYNMYFYSQRWDTNYVDLLAIETFDSSLQGQVPYTYNGQDLAFKLSCSQFNFGVINATLNLYIWEYPSGILIHTLQLSIPVYCTNSATQIPSSRVLVYFITVCCVLLVSLSLILCGILYLLVKMHLVKKSKRKRHSKNDKEKGIRKDLIKYGELEINGVNQKTKLAAIVPSNLIETNLIAMYPILDRKLVKEDKIKNTESLREGNFSYLAKGYINNGNYITPVLIKTCSSYTSAQLIQENTDKVTVLSCITHPNFLSLEALCINSSDIPIFAYPLPNLGILKLFLKSIRLIFDKNPGARVMNFEDILFIGQQIAKAMNYIVSKNLVHKDLASRNVYMHEGLLAKIGDPAFSYDLYSNEYYQLEPDLEPIAVKWQPIEVLLSRRYSEASDVWSFGTLLWEILTYGDTPYEEIQCDEMIQHLSSGHRLDCPHNCSKDLFILISCSWSLSPEERPKFSDIERQLDFLHRACTTYL